MTDQLKTAMDGLLAALEKRAATEGSCETSDASGTPAGAPTDHAPSIPWTAAQTMLLERLTAVCDAGGIAVICGARGTGKTTMAQEMIRRAGRGVYELCQDYFEQVSLLVQGKLYRGIAEARSFRDLRVRTRLLVLDEVLHVSRDPLGERVLEDIVIRRHAANRPTILICNATKADLRLADSIMDRVRDGGGVFQPRWDSFRGHKHP